MTRRRTLPESVHVTLVVDFNKSNLNQEKKFIQKIYETQLPWLGGGQILTEYFSLCVETMKLSRENYDTHIKRLTQDWDQLFDEAQGKAGHKKNGKNGKKK